MKWVKENITNIPSLSLFIDHVEVIELNVLINPTLCVETCKSLVEGLCKTILTNKNIDYSNNISFSALVQLTITSTLNTDEACRDDIVDLARRIAGVADKLSSIRNHAGFVSHGMDILNPRLTETLSMFAYKIADTIAGFILRCYINNRVLSADHRIHYEDCSSFNEYFDDLHSLPLGLSASRALIEQDYEAYKESYYEYLTNLAADIETLMVENVS